MTDTTIYIGSIAVHEPMTVFTDYIITILSLGFFFRIPTVDNAAVRNWRLFFLFMALSTGIGSNSHAFFAVHEGLAYKSIWLPMQVLNAFAVYFAQQATLQSVLKNAESRNAWKWSYVVQLIIYIIILMIVQKFVVTIIDNALGLIPIMVLHFTAKEKEPYYKYIGYGIVISFITAIVHGFKLSLCAYFNFNDIAHVFIMISLYVMFRGVKLKAGSVL